MEYKEILKLKKKLEKANIPFEFTDDMFSTKKAPPAIRHLLKDQYPAYQIIIKKNGVILCDAIQNTLSYGNKADKLEISGALTAAELANDEVLGYLTAAEVFKRFKYCYINNTRVYEEEQTKCQNY